MDFESAHRENMKDSGYRSAYENHRRRMDRAERLTRWMNRIPGVGNVARVFWYLTLTEDSWDGVVDGMQFSFLNDGMSPTVWATYMNAIDHPRYSGIWTDGAPHDRQEAEKILARAQLLDFIRHWSQP